MLSSQQASVVPPTHFIGGIHGVGKGTFARAISVATGLDHRSAGEMIKRHRHSTQAETKPVKDVQGNQRLLLEALQALELTTPLLLDGHFCLLTKDFSLQPIPFGTFEHLNLKSIIVLTDTPERIRQHLSNRDGTEYSTELLTQFQSAEIELAKETSAKLRVPFAVLTADQVPQACAHIHNSTH